MREADIRTQYDQHNYDLKKVVDLTRITIGFAESGEHATARQTFNDSLLVLQKIPQLEGYLRSAGWRSISEAAVALGALHFAIEAESNITVLLYRGPSRTNTVGTPEGWADRAGEDTSQREVWILDRPGTPTG